MRSTPQRVAVSADPTRGIERVGTIAARLWSVALIGGLALWPSAHPPFLAPAFGSPAPPILVWPAASATSVPTPPDLTVDVSDPVPEPLTVSFYGRPLGAAAQPDFTLIDLPDTQNYVSYISGGTPAIFRAQTEWVVANRALRNIVYVCQLGDCVENGDNGGNPIEWQFADDAMSLVEDPATTTLPEGIPFSVCVGNHDGGNSTTVLYNQFFGTNRFTGRSYYGGHFGNDNDNFYDLFSAGGLDFIVIGFQLMWNQEPPVVHWADSLLTVYSDRHAIISTHYLIEQGNPGSFSPQGQAIYNGLKGHSNLFLMLGGHVHEEGRRVDPWLGHTINSVMADYQDRANGGDGWLRILEFSPAENVIRFRTYSPTLDRYETDADSSSQFTLDFDMQGGDRDFRLIGRVPGVLSGSTVTMPWAGLSLGDQYEWYVTVEGGSSMVTGPAWQFSTPDGLRPTVHVLAPNSGTSLTMGQLALIQWSATDSVGVQSVDVLISRNGPTGHFVSIAKRIANSGSIPWYVTEPATSDGYVKVVAHDSSGHAGQDVNDQPFSILYPLAVGDGPGAGTALAPVSPNPARGSSRLTVTLARSGPMQLRVFDVGGHEMATLADGPAAAGRHDYVWDGRTAAGPAPSGLYFGRLVTAERTCTQRFMLVR